MHLLNLPTNGGGGEEGDLFQDPPDLFLPCGLIVHVYLFPQYRRVVANLDTSPSDVLGSPPVVRTLNNA